ncbi:MAG: FAD-dependent monooxygenase [Pseudomonadota bacterium]
MAARPFDAVVVGGGPVGCVAALTLRARGLSVALLERSAPATVANELGVDARTVALTPASRRQLVDLNAWPAVATGVRAIEVWEERGTAVLPFELQARETREAGSDESTARLAYLTEVGPWRLALWERLAAAGVERVVAAVERVVPEGPPWRIDLVDADPVQAGLLIGADGANSAVRAAFDVPLKLQDTGHSALAFAAELERPHESVAYQRFLAGGPLALLPLAPARTVSVVWSLPHEDAAALARLAPEDFAARFDLATDQRLGRTLRHLNPVCFPLRQGVAADFQPAEGVALIGDAARVIHPLAGQGVNLGFEDVAALAAALDGGGWRRFARLRRARSQLAVAAMSFLAGAYAPQSPAMLLARNAAVRALAGSDWLRDRLTAEAMGTGLLARVR